MPVNLARLGLGESPCEHVRNHVFEWEHEEGVCGRGMGGAESKKAEGAKKAGRHSPSRQNQPGNDTPPHVDNLSRSP